MNKSERLKNSERVRRALALEVTEAEYADIKQAVEDMGDSTIMGFLRNAIEQYTGQKIFRPRCDSKKRIPK